MYPNGKASAREPSCTYASHDPMRTDAQLDVINAAIQAEHGELRNKVNDCQRGHGHRPGLTNYALCLSSRF